MAPCVAKYVWFRKEPSREGRSGKMLEETLLEYTLLKQRRWHNIPITLTDAKKGEAKAQACDMACSRQLPSYVPVCGSRENRMTARQLLSKL